MRGWLGQPGKIAVIAVASVATLGLGGTAPHGAEATSSEFEVDVERLGDGAYRYTVIGTGVTVVGSSGLTVQVVRSGHSGRVGVSVGNDADAAAQADEYERLGRSPVKDAVAAGIDGSLLAKIRAAWEAHQEGGSATSPLAPAQIVGGGRIYSSFCIHDSDGNLEWDGCVIRAYDPSDADPTYNYYVDQAQGSGHETSSIPWYQLEKGGVENRYNTSNVTILHRSPASDIERSDCVSMGLGVSIGGFGASVSGTVCPDLWDQTFDGSGGVRAHRVVWHGNTHNDRQADALTLFKKRSTHSSAYELWTYWEYG